MHFPSSSRSSLPASLGLAALGLVSLGLAAAPARAQTQDLFVSNGNAGTISRFAGTGPGTFSTTATTLSGLNTPDGLAFDGRGDLFAVNSISNSITEFAAGTTPGTFGATSTLSGTLNGPAGLAFDGGGDLFATNFNNNSVTEFASTGTGTFAAGKTVETGLNGPTFLAFSPVPAVPEASTTVSLGLLLALGMGGTVMAARKKRKA